MSRFIAFSDHGPFDGEEREVIHGVINAIETSASPAKTELIASVMQSVRQLDSLGEVLASYPSVFGAQSLGGRKRDVNSLLASLSRATPSNFDMCLPTRALVVRTLVMGEVNFWRLLHFACNEALEGEPLAKLHRRVEPCMCHCLYTRLAEVVLIGICSDDALAAPTRNRAALGLMHIWERSRYRVSDFFPVLEATWDARRRFPAVLGTLLGTAEMFRLIEEGCDERFVDYLVHPDRSEDEEAAFREFLFGATTEHLRQIEQQMAASGRGSIGVADVPDSARLRDACAGKGDPALAMFEFFLYRHLQASARRQADLPGPKRTAEEYVMITYLDNDADAAHLSVVSDENGC